MPISDKDKKDLNIGDDPRLFEKFTIWFQKLTQVTFMRHWDTFFSPTFELFPPGGFYSITIPFTEKEVEYWIPEKKEGPKFLIPVHTVMNIRAGWLWIPAVWLCRNQEWPWWAYLIGILGGLFLNWRRDRNSGESYWTLSVNFDHEAMRW